MSALASAGQSPRTVTRGGLTVNVPPPGTGVRASALLVTGETRSLAVETAVDGRVLIVEEPGTAALDRDARAASASAPRPDTGVAGSPPACQDGKHNVTGSWWHSTFHWLFKAASKPSNLTIASAEYQLKRSVSNITHSRNDCGLADQVSAVARYDGRTTRGTHIGSNSTCTTTDDVNVVAFGDLSSSTVGFTCWWYRGTTTVEADVQLNKHDFGWAASTSSCFNQYIIQGVATHEFGHVFGLGHVSQASHANLTMSTAIYPCDASDATLGLGDVLGLRTHY
jgi:hypothetical protein